MALLSIHVLGPLLVKLSDEPVTGFVTDKVRALLVYLALSPDRPHRREALAGLLWPEFPERSARTNLRNALANLRQVIRDREASRPFLHSTRQTIQFNAHSDYWLDAEAFEDLLALLPANSLQLEQAVSLVRGLFFEGFTLADAAPFEEWLLLRREHLNRQVIEALDRLVVIHEGHGDFESAVDHARRRVELEPWQEEGQRQLMGLLARCGRRSEALAHYEDYRRELAADLGAEPAPETTRLYEQVRTGGLALPTLAPAQVRDRKPTQRLPGFLEQETDAVDPPPMWTGRWRATARWYLSPVARAVARRLCSPSSGGGQWRPILICWLLRAIAAPILALAIPICPSAKPWPCSPAMSKLAGWPAPSPPHRPGACGLRCLLS
jgi:DNA-binding SARP family transcriptional activator